MKARSPRQPKEQRVIETLRRELLRGVYPIQSKLPIQTELARRFRVGGGTVQRALHQLISEGFLQARRRHGTFVVGRPPHLKNYALIFHSEPVQGTWSKYYAALTNAAVALEQQGDRRLLLFYGIDRHQDTEDHQRLLGYLRAQRLGGLIFDNAPHGLRDTPLLDETDMPRVAFMSHAMIPNVRAVGFNQARFLERAVGWLGDQRRRRVGFLSTQGMHAHDERQFEELLAAQGMRSPAHWRLPVSLSPRAATRCVQLLMQGAPADRPDALIISDDNLVEAALAGLVAAGLRVPQDLDVVVHCNFPCPSATVLPVKRLGYDIRQALRAAIDLIDRSRRGETGPELQRIDPVFEEELPEDRVTTLDAETGVENHVRRPATVAD